MTTPTTAVARSEDEPNTDGHSWPCRSYPHQRDEGDGFVDDDSKLERIAAARKDELIERWTELAPKAHYRTRALAAKCGVCPRTLERQFNQVLGLNPKEWLSRLLITEAKRSLLAGRPVKGFVVELGFSQVRNFSRFFRQKTGVAPREFVDRERCRLLSKKA